MFTPGAIVVAHSEDSAVQIYRPKGDESPLPAAAEPPALAPEFGGRKDASEPTRFGDWEKQGRCIDF